jgi:hypothetical protein
MPKLRAVCHIRDQIDGRIRQLLIELVPASG